jgi:quinol monooxygenase YgiN
LNEVLKKHPCRHRDSAYPAAGPPRTPYRFSYNLKTAKRNFMVSKGLLVRLEVQAGRDPEAEHLLVSALSLVRQEPGTTAWFAIRFGRSEYGIFDVFPDEAAREAHLGGDIARSLLQQGATLFTAGPQVQKLDVLAHKLPPAPPGPPDTKALLLTFKAKAGVEAQVEQLLREAQPLVLAEPDTTSWFAIRLDSGEYGIFDTFPDKSGRFKHLIGQVPRELAKHALTLLGSVPDMEMLNLITEKRPE